MAGGSLPAIKRVSFWAPFRWLGGAWGDMRTTPVPFLIYGLALGLVSLLLCWALVISNVAFWVLALTCGFVFVAPMLAMGLYDAGRVIELGGMP